MKYLYLHGLGQKPDSWNRVIKETKVSKDVYKRQLMGLPFSEEAEPMGADPDVLEYFLFSLTADFGEVMQDIIADDN